MQSLSQWRVGLGSGALVSLILSCAVTSFGQSLGDIARQERERRKEEPPHASYVYTNDDLRRQHILVPEDQARVLAARRSASTPAVQVSQVPAPGLSVPASDLPASGKMGAIVPTLTPLKTRLDALTEDSTNIHLQTQLSTGPVISPVQPNRLLLPSTRRKSERPGIVTGLVVSPSDLSGQQPHRAIVEREPVDSGMAAVVVTVERGDSLWKLAERYLGKGTRWRELAALNTQISNVDVIRVGEWICLPARNLQTARQTIAPRAPAPGSFVRGGVVITSPSPVFTAQIANHR